MTTGNQFVDHDTRGMGWKMFAGLMIIMVGAFNIADGLVAITDDSYFTKIGGSDQLPLTNDVKLYGWVVFAWGLLLVICGGLIFVGNTFGRGVGLVAAVGNAMLQLAFLAHYPSWSAIIILIDVLVVYALAVHGGAAYRDPR
jgi:hypothetical protein